MVEIDSVSVNNGNHLRNLRRKIQSILCYLTNDHQSCILSLERLGLETLTSRYRLGLGTIRLIYNPANDIE